MSFRRMKARSLPASSSSTFSRYGVAPIGSPSLSSCRRAARSHSSTSISAGSVGAQGIPEALGQIRGSPRQDRQRVGAIPQLELARVLGDRLEHDVKGRPECAELLFVDVRETRVERQPLRALRRLREHHVQRLRLAARLAGGSELLGQLLGGSAARLLRCRADARAPSWPAPRPR